MRHLWGESMGESMIHLMETLERLVATHRGKEVKGGKPALAKALRDPRVLDLLGELS